MEKIPKPGEFYRHFKNKLYQIVAVAEHTETGEQLVVYQALYGDFRIYARPLSMFISKVDRDKYPEAEQEYRFEQVVFVARKRKTKPESLPEEENFLPEEDSLPEEESFLLEEDSLPEEDDFEELDLDDPPDEYLDEDYDEEEKTPTQWLEYFLDAQGYEKQLEILAQMRGRVGKNELDSICLVLGIPTVSGDEESQLSTIIQHLETRRHYDSGRLRPGRWK